MYACKTGSVCFKFHTHLYSGLSEVKLKCKGLPHEDIRVVTIRERVFQFLQLPGSEVGSCSATLLRVTVVTVCAGVTV